MSHSPEVQPALDALNLVDPQSLECPYGAYQTLRDQAPVYQVPQTGFYVVSRYDLVMDAVRNTEVFSSAMNQNASTGGIQGYPKIVELFEKEGYPFANTLISADPPEHTRYRKLVNRAFTASRVRKMQGYIQQIVDELIDDFIDRGAVEFVTEFAIKLPIYIIADQLGVPRSDMQKFKDWSDAAVPIGLDIGEEAELERARLVVAFQHYFVARITEVREDPRDDIISDLVHARVDDERPLDIPELLSIIQQLLVAGNETTTNALASGLVLLMENPNQLAILKQAIADGRDKELRTFCEEVLRLEAPVSGLFRVTTCDTELGGFPIPAGSLVNLRWAAANRDERVFDDAGALDGFGVGVHFCVGAQLAREEMFLGFKSLLSRLDHIRMVENHPPLEHHPNFILRGLKELHLTFKKAPVTEAAA